MNNFIYLENSYIELNGLTIYGSPHTPNFKKKAFTMLDDELKEKWKKIPENIDILLTHTPPFGN